MLRPSKKVEGRGGQPISVLEQIRGIKGVTELSDWPSTYSPGAKSAGNWSLSTSNQSSNDGLTWFLPQQLQQQ